MGMRHQDKGKWCRQSSHRPSHTRVQTESMSHWCRLRKPNSHVAGVDIHTFLSGGKQCIQDHSPRSVSILGNADSSPNAEGGLAYPMCPQISGCRESDVRTAPWLKVSQSRDASNRDSSLPTTFIKSFLRGSGIHVRPAASPLTNLFKVASTLINTLSREYPIP